MPNIPLSNIPLSNIPLHTIPLSIIPLSNIPLSNIPLPNIPLSTIPLSIIPLSIEANTTNDNALREKVGQLLAKREAVMVESMMAVGKPEDKVATESGTEFIYVTEYEPGELPNIITLDDAATTNKIKLPDYATGPSP